MVELVKVLNNLFVAKTKGSTVEVDESFLVRVSACELLRAFIDPTVSISLRQGYTPHRLELEMVYAAIRNTYPSQEVTSEALFMFALDRLGVYGGYRSTPEVDVNDESRITM